MRLDPLPGTVNPLTQFDSQNDSREAMVHVVAYRTIKGQTFQAQYRISQYSRREMSPVAYGDLLQDVMVRLDREIDGEVRKLEAPVRPVTIETDQNCDPRYMYAVDPSLAGYHGPKLTGLAALVNSTGGVHPVGRGRSSISNPSEQSLPLTLNNADKALTEAYAPALKANLKESVHILNNFSAQFEAETETPTMAFNEHTVYLTDEQEVRARSGEMRRKEALAVLTEGFLPEIVLEAGDVVGFNDSTGNRYEICRVDGNDMIVRRLVANSHGPAGETHPATISQYVAKVRSGEAFVVEYNEDGEEV